MAGTDVIEAITHDHHEVEQLFARFEQTTDPQQRKRVSEQAIIELVRHSVGEEAYVYPVARTVIPDGDSLVEHEISEHAAAEKMMNDLDGLDADHPRFEPQMVQLMGAIREHVREEEGQLLPQLRQHVSAEDLATIGERFQAAKKAAPTRPHPAAPDHPPFNKMLAPGAALVDRVRDWLTGRGKA